MSWLLARSMFDNLSSTACHLKLQVYRSGFRDCLLAMLLSVPWIFSPTPKLRFSHSSELANQNLGQQNKKIYRLPWLAALLETRPTKCQVVLGTFPSFPLRLPCWQSVIQCVSAPLFCWISIGFPFEVWSVGFFCCLLTLAVPCPLCFKGTKRGIFSTFTEISLHPRQIIAVITLMLLMVTLPAGFPTAFPSQQSPIPTSYRARKLLFLSYSWMRTSLLRASSFLRQNDWFLQILLESCYTPASYTCPF